MRHLAFAAVVSTVVSIASLPAMADGVRSDASSSRKFGLPASQSSVVVTEQNGVRVWRPTGTDADQTSYSTTTGGGGPSVQYATPYVGGGYGGGWAGGYGAFGFGKGRFGDRGLGHHPSRPDVRHGVVGGFPGRIGVTIKTMGPQSAGPRPVFASRSSPRIAGVWHGSRPMGLGVKAGGPKGHKGGFGHH